MSDFGRFHTFLENDGDSNHDRIDILASPISFLFEKGGFSPVSSINLITLRFFPVWDGNELPFNFINHKLLT